VRANPSNSIEVPRYVGANSGYKLDTHVPEESTMALRFLGKDPDSQNGQSPTVWDDGDSYVVQGWRITDAETLAGVGDVPEHETVIRIPKRLMPVFPEVNGGSGPS
jgi:hypothetical protein